MENSNISELSGRALDAAIETELEAVGISPPFITRAYSTDGNAMLELIGELRKRDGRFTLWTVEGGWSAHLTFGSFTMPDASELADTLPLAVARAALVALRAVKEGGQ